jgi:hypothetical protein
MNNSRVMKYNKYKIMKNIKNPLDVKLIKKGLHGYVL